MTAKDEDFSPAISDRGLEGPKQITFRGIVDRAADGFRIRGGSFASRPKDATSSWRWGYEPWQKVYDVGFRVLIEE